MVGRLLVCLVVLGVWLMPAVAHAQPADPPAAPPPSSPVPDGPPSGGWVPPWDIGGLVRDAINNWVHDLVADALSPMLDLVGRSVLATPDLARPGGRVAELWGVSAGLANTGYVLLIVLGGTLVMTHETLDTRMAVKDAAPRLLFGAVASNLSLTLVGWGVQLANALASGLLGQGVDPANVRQAFERMLPPFGEGPVILLVLGLAVDVLGLVLVASYVVRVALLVVLTVAAPLLLALHALPQTEELARLWWRATAALLGAQVGQSLVLISAVRVWFEADREQVLGLGAGRMVDLLVVACLLWLLVRIPVWAARVAMTGRPSMVVQMARSYVLYRLVRRTLGRVAR